MTIQLFNYFKMSVQDLLKNKGRTILTSLGIIIGVYSVVLLLSLGEGIKIYLSRQFEDLGSNLIFIIPGQFENVQSQRSLFGGAKFTTTDFQRLKTRLPQASVVPIAFKNISASSSQETEQTSLLGSTTTIQNALNLVLGQGRFFSKNEEVGGRRVVVIGPKLAEKLFPNTSALRQTIRISGLRFQVIGVLKIKGGGGFGDPSFDDYLYTPYKTVHSLAKNKNFFSFYIQSPTKERVPVLSNQIKKILLQRYKEEDFSVTTQDELLSTITEIFAVINGVLVGIAAISLLVGGVGITNIMYVVVTEKTKEIGIRRAVGATRRNILFRFLTQAILLTTAGGVAGLLLAFATNLAVYSIFPATITLPAVLLSFFVSFFIGVTFGVFPARKAANMSPVEAIRFE